MSSRPASTTRRSEGGAVRRAPALVGAGLLVAAAVAVPVVIRDGGDAGSTPAASSSVSEAGVRAAREEDGASIPLRDFPLDRGWPEAYGESAVNGPDPGAGGISMPEGHCQEGVLFDSGYADKLSAYVTSGRVSLTREILRYPDPRRARSTLRSLRSAVAACDDLDDAYAPGVAYSAQVFHRIDAANAAEGVVTLTFAYTAPDSTPFSVIYQFARVGDLIYGSNRYGPWTARSARRGVVSLDADNAALTRLLPRVEG
ncbi:hypothetical protein [Nocardioides lijunqiniae]|uniref:hypothetical protein n=1 Tax=Nocardioides lijunqiniae TaxID=2760832 RepID=UPI001878064E|nr:hypothetical protein [Nocardioides lijunqiniae]